MSSSRRIRLAALLLVATWPTSARAREAGAAADDPVLASLVEEALACNPDLAAAREALAAGRARPQQAQALPDPMLSLTYTNDGWSPSLGSRDMTTLGVMWSQDLPFPGKRALRGRIASLEADATEQRLERTRLSLVAGVRRAYYGLLLARELAELIREQGQVWHEIEGVARARYAVGQGAQPDVLRVQVEVTRIEQLRAAQLAEAEIRRAELNRLLGRPADAPVETDARLALRADLLRADASLARAEAVSPELKAARLAVERDRAAVALARKELKPDFTIQAGYMNRRSLDAMWQAGVGITLPLYRKKRESAIAEAEARLLASERVVDAVALQLRYRTQERLAQLEAAEQIAVLYEKGVILQDRMAVEAGVANYQAGKVPFVAVLEALVSLYADRSSLLATLAGHARATAALEEASLEAASDLPPAADPRGAGGAMAGGASDSMAAGGMGGR